MGGRRKRLDRERMIVKDGKTNSKPWRDSSWLEQGRLQFSERGQKTRQDSRDEARLIGAQSCAAQTDPGVRDGRHSADMNLGDLTRHTYRRHYGCPLPRTPRASDGRLVPAGLLARGSNASPPPSRRMDRQWLSGATLAAYSCGGSRGVERPMPLVTAFPFHPPPLLRSAARPSRAHKKPKAAAES